MAKNFLAKTRPADKPYLVYKDGSGWTWKVLKANRADPNAPYASWFCLVTSPMTGSGGDMGDTYVSDVVKYGTLVFRDPDVPDAAIPDAAKVSDPWEGW